MACVDAEGPWHAAHLCASQAQRRRHRQKCWRPALQAPGPAPRPIPDPRHAASINAGGQEQGGERSRACAARGRRVRACLQVTHGGFRTQIQTQEKQAWERCFWQDVAAAPDDGAGRAGQGGS